MWHMLCTGYGEQETNHCTSELLKGKDLFLVQSCSDSVQEHEENPRLASVIKPCKAQTYYTPYDLISGCHSLLYHSSIPYVFFHFLV